MARFVKKRWVADPNSFGGRRDRASGTSEAYLPERIASSDLLVRASTAALLSDAEQALLRLNENPPVLGNLEAVARRLLRAESVASSRIEGLVLSHRRLAKAELAGPEARDETAAAVLANIHAMEQAIRLGASTTAWTIAAIAELHRTLMADGPLAPTAGRLREVQNWIGGGSLSPRDAEFIPPPPEEVEPALSDLCRFLDRRDLSPAFQAAVAHAQFETLHPFADGNGRVGRALIHSVLRRRGLVVQVLPPLSLILGRHGKAYVRGLTAYRAGNWDDWLELFAASLAESVAEARRLAIALAQLQDQWRAQVGHPRSDSAAAAIIELLPSHPMITIAVLQERTGRSKQGINEAVARLQEAGVLAQITVGKRHRAWEAVGLLELVDAFEKAVAQRG